MADGTLILNIFAALNKTHGVFNGMDTEAKILSIFTQGIYLTMHHPEYAVALLEQSREISKPLGQDGMQLIRESVESFVEAYPIEEMEI